MMEKLPNEPSDEYKLVSAELMREEAIEQKIPTPAGGEIDPNLLELRNRAAELRSQIGDVAADAIDEDIIKEEQVDFPNS